MASTIVSLFDSLSDARNVIRDLINKGFRQEDIHVVSNDLRSEEASEGKLISSLTSVGVPEDAARAYNDGVRRGGTLVTVNAADTMVDPAMDVMYSYGAVDVNRRREQTVAQQSSANDGAGDSVAPPVEQNRFTSELPIPDGSIPEPQTTDRPNFQPRSNGSEVALPVVEEELQVGKRALERGGLRVHNRIIETPVEQVVHLREEHVTVERRQVDRPVSDADLSAFKEATIEIVETVEEPVVTKRARVVEEIIINKNVEERAETIRDSVRRTNVEIEQLGTAKVMTNGTSKS